MSAQKRSKRQGKGGVSKQKKAKVRKVGTTNIARPTGKVAVIALKQGREHVVGRVAKRTENRLYLRVPAYVNPRNYRDEESGETKFTLGLSTVLFPVFTNYQGAMSDGIPFALEDILLEGPPNEQCNDEFEAWEASITHPAFAVDEKDHEALMKGDVTDGNQAENLVPKDADEQLVKDNEEDATEEDEPNAPEPTSWNSMKEDLSSFNDGDVVSKEIISSAMGLIDFVKEKTILQPWLASVLVGGDLELSFLHGETPVLVRVLGPYDVHLSFNPNTEQAIPHDFEMFPEFNPSTLANAMEALVDGFGPETQDEYIHAQGWKSFHDTLQPWKDKAEPNVLETAEIALAAIQANTNLVALSVHAVEANHLLIGFLHFSLPVYVNILNTKVINLAVDSSSTTLVGFGKYPVFTQHSELSGIEALVTAFNKDLPRETAEIKPDPPETVEAEDLDGEPSTEAVPAEESAEDTPGV